MLKLTSWKPVPQAGDRHHRAISAAVRHALPALADSGQPVWAIGEQRWQVAPDPLQAFDLRWLEWHQVSAGSCAQRASGQWNFRGEGLVAAHPVDFYGAYVRDLRTGAFREFQLHIAGLPKHQ